MKPTAIRRLVKAYSIAIDKIESRHYINGAFATSSDGKCFTLKSPYSHKKIADVSEPTVDDTNRAVAAAKAAFPAWSSMDISTRGSYMKKMGALIAKKLLV